MIAATITMLFFTALLTVCAILLHVWDWIAERRRKPRVHDDFRRSSDVGWGTPGTEVPQFLDPDPEYRTVPPSDEVSLWARRRRPFDYERDGS